MKNLHDKDDKKTLRGRREPGKNHGPRRYRGRSPIAYSPDRPGHEDPYLPAPLCLHCAGTDHVEDTDVYFALVGTRGTAGIAQGNFNLPDNIAEIGHGVVTPPATCRVQKKREQPAGPGYNVGHNAIYITRMVRV
jgi:hypothetical protein